MYCVFALLMGMLLANMFQNVCGCKVVEGGSITAGSLQVEGEATVDDYGDIIVDKNVGLDGSSTFHVGSDGTTKVGGVITQKGKAKIIVDKNPPSSIPPQPTPITPPPSPNPSCPPGQSPCFFKPKICCTPAQTLAAATSDCMQNPSSNRITCFTLAAGTS